MKQKHLFSLLDNSYTTVKVAFTDQILPAGTYDDGRVDLGEYDSCAAVRGPIWARFVRRLARLRRGAVTVDADTPTRFRSHGTSRTVTR